VIVQLVRLVESSLAFSCQILFVFFSFFFFFFSFFGHGYAVPLHDLV
jgi:hypothetical protein